MHSDGIYGVLESYCYTVTQLLTISTYVYLAMYQLIEYLIL